MDDRSKHDLPEGFVAQTIARLLQQGKARMFKTTTVCVAAIVLGVLSCGREKMADAKTGVTRADIIATRYEPDASIFPNPERGFYIYTNLHKLDPAIGKRRDEGHTLLRDGSSWRPIARSRSCRSRSSPQ